MTNETTASERERFEAWARAKTTLSLTRHPEEAEEYFRASTDSAWIAWQARAALPAPADQPPEPQGSSGSLSESSAEAGTQDAAPAFDPLSGPTEIRRRAAIAEAAWWCKNAARHVRFVSIDAASSIDDRTAAVRAADEAIDKLAALL